MEMGVGDDASTTPVLNLAVTPPRVVVGVVGLVGPAGVVIGAWVGAWVGAGALVGAWVGAGALVGAWVGAGALVGALVVTGALVGALVGAWVVSPAGTVWWWCPCWILVS